MNFEIMYQNITFTTFVLFMFFSLIQIIYRKTLSANYFLSGAYLATGLCFLNYWAFSLGLLSRAPLFIYMEIGYSFLAAPFFYLYFSTISGVREYGISSVLFRLIPSLLAFVLIIICNLTDPAIGRVYGAGTGIFPDYSVNRIIEILNTVCDIYVTSHILMGVYNISIFFRMKTLTREVRFLMIYLMVFAVGGILLIIANFTGREFLRLLGLSFFMFMPAFQILYSFRNPEFTMRVIRNARSIRYSKNISRNRDIAVIEKRLIQLMEDEKIFENPDLSLKGLADKLMITERQLSSLINDRFHKNYNTYINTYRINQAKELLRSEPGRTIIEIAFLCGFNSISSFYTYFRRETKISPHDYLKIEA